MIIKQEDEQIIIRNGKRIDFSADEIVFMRQQAALQNGDRSSYASIARELNHKFRDHNEGHRTRQSVYEFMTADPDAPVIERVAIPRELLRQAKAAGLNIESMVIAKIKEALNSCETSTPPVLPENASSAAGSSPSQESSSTSTATGSSSSQSKKSGNQVKRR